MFRNIFKIIGRILIILLLVVCGLLSIIQIPAIQKKIVTNYVLPTLEKQYGTKFQAEEVSITFFGNVELKGVTAIDHHNTKFIYIEKAVLHPDLIDLVTKDTLNLDHITLEKPQVNVITYQGEKQNNFIKFFNQFKSKHPSGKKTYLKLSAKLSDGSCSIQDFNLPKKEQNILNASAINLDLANFFLEDTDIFAQISKFSAKALNAQNKPLDIKQLATDFTYQKDRIQLAKLDLQTTQSELSGSFAFLYDDIAAFDDFFHKIKWKAHFTKGSYIGMRDVQYWVPMWNKTQAIKISGYITGVLANLNLQNIDLQSDKTILKGNLQLKNIYDARKYEIKSDKLFAQTTYTSLQYLLPQSIGRSIPDLLNRFGTMTYNGNVYLSPKQILIKNSYAKSTTLGNVQLDHLDLQDYTKENIKYDATIIATNFKLNLLINNNTIGNITGKINAKGSGRSIQNLAVQTNSNLQEINLLGKKIHNIKIDGIWKNQAFVGKIISKDSRMPFVFDGNIKTAEDKYDAQFKLHVDQIDLFQLGILSDPKARLTSDIYLIARAKKLDDLVGQIVLENTTLINSKKNIQFQKMILNSDLSPDGIRTLNIQAKEIINGYIEGHYNLSELLTISHNAFGKLLPQYKEKPMTANQSLKFDLYLKDYLFELFFPSLTVRPETYLTGEITSENQLIMKTTTAGIIYKDYELGPAEIHLNTENPFFQSSLKTDWMKIKQYDLKDVRLLTINNHDTIDIKAKFTGEFQNNIKQEYNFNLYYAKTAQQKELLGFKRSTIQYNNNEWVINPFNEARSHYAILDFDKNEYFINKIKLESGEQKMELNGEYLQDFLGLNLTMQDIRIETLIPPMEDTQLSGLANGKLKLTYDKGLFKPIADFTVDKLSLNNYEIGDVTSNIALEDGLYQVKSMIMRNGIKSLTIDGNINPREEKNMLALKLGLNDFKLEVLNGFLDGVFENIKGDVNGEIELIGSFKNPEYMGSVTVSKTRLKVSYLGVDYKVEGKPEILISTGTIRFYDKIILTDIKTNSHATLTGSLEHKNFTDWYLRNIFIRSKKLLVLDTNYGQNPLFYGKVYAKDLIANINGPAKNLSISVIATTGANSKLTINSGGTSLDMEQNVRFVNLKKQNENKVNTNLEDLLPELTGLDIKLDTKITPDAQIELILDEQTNHKMLVRGNGDLLLNVDTSGNFKMDGEIYLTKGIYNFALANNQFLQREFKIRPGSNIKWMGDVFAAALDVNAYYDKSVSNISEYLGNNYSQTLDTELEVNIGGLLSAPTIDFAIKIPEAPETVRNTLEQKFLDEDEEKNQWFYILTLGQFMPNDDKSSLLSYGLKSSVFDAATGIISSAINNTISFLTVNMKFIEGNPTYNTSDIIKASAKFRTQSRLNVTTGVNIVTNFTGNTSNTQQNSVDSWEAEIEYDISKKHDGTLKLKAFTRPTSFGIENFNATEASSQATGLGIYYHEDFNTFKEFKEKIKERTKSKKTIEKEAKEKQRLDSLDHALETQEHFLK